MSAEDRARAETLVARSERSAAKKAERKRNHETARSASFKRKSSDRNTAKKIAGKAAKTWVKR